jgi:hypothetical protein
MKSLPTASTCSMQFLDKDFIPDALQPFKGKLTERFFEVRIYAGRVASAASTR